MRFFKYIFSAILIALVIFGIYRYKNSSIKQTSFGPVKEYFNNVIEHELEDVKLRLASIGISEKTFDAIHQNQSYEQPKKRSSRKKNVSPETTQLVQQIIKQCGLDPNKIYLERIRDDMSPAIASEDTIYLNEEILSKLSDKAQSFIIAHEIQHIINHDTGHYTEIADMVGITAEELADNGKVNHPLCYYSRFIEKRADMQAALLGPKWAEYYLTCTKENLESCDVSSGTHPTDQERYKLAQSIIDYMQPKIA